MKNKKILAIGLCGAICLSIAGVYLCKRIGFGHTKGFNIRNGKHIQRRYSLSGYRRWTNQR